MKYSLMPGSTRLDTKRSLGSLRSPKKSQRRKLRGMFTPSGKSKRKAKGPF